MIGEKNFTGSIGLSEQELVVFGQHAHYNNWKDIHENKALPFFVKLKDKSVRYKADAQAPTQFVIYEDGVIFIYVSLWKGLYRDYTEYLRVSYEMINCLIHKGMRIFRMTTSAEDEFMVFVGKI